MPRTQDEILDDLRVICSECWSEVEAGYHGKSACELLYRLGNQRDAIVGNLALQLLDAGMTSIDVLDVLREANGIKVDRPYGLNVRKAA